MTRKFIHPALVFVISTALLFGALAVMQNNPARVSAGSCAEDPANLLKNGTMAGDSPNTYGVVAKNWKAFIVGATRPHFENALNEGYDPNGSQYIWRDFDAWDAGIYQKVKTLTPGQTYHFWMVWGQALHDMGGDNARATKMNRQIGIDMTGGTDPNSSNVTWSVPYYGGGGFNRSEWNLNFVAAGTTATFFLRAQNGHLDGRNKVFFDTACLYPAGTAATSTPWSPTPTATQTLAPSATPSRTPTQTSIPGTKIDDVNANITYTGMWTQGADSRALNGTYHYARGVKGAAVAATYNFTGTQVTVWYIGYKNRGKAKVMIDGVKVGVIDQYTPGVAFNLSQSFYNLAPGAHQLKIRNAGAKSPVATDTIITLDAIEVPNAVAGSEFKFVAQRLTRTPMAPPAPTNTRVPPRVIPFAFAAPAAPTPTDPSVIWDSRLAGLNVYLEPANVSAGTLYWKLIRADYQDGYQSGGNHNMYYVITNEQGAPVANQTVWQSWPDDKTSTQTNGSGTADIAMWANYWPDQGPGPYNGYVGGLPGDQVRGMGLPGNNHVNFILYFQKTVKGEDGNVTATPTPTFTRTHTPTRTFTATPAPPTPTHTVTRTATSVPSVPAPTDTPTLTPTGSAPTPTVTPTSISAGSKIDDTDAAIAFTSGWTMGSDARAFNRTYHYARGVKGSPVKFGYNFTGTQIKLWYIGYKNRGKAVVKIDGVRRGVIDQYTRSVTFDLSQTYGDLAPGSHNLKVLNKGNKNPGSSDTIIVLDALEVLP